MSRYLEEAASLLRKADTHNDKSRLPNQDTRLKISQGFAMLAAIDKGLLPAEITQDVIAAIAVRHSA